MSDSPRLKISLDSILQVIVIIYQGYCRPGIYLRLVPCQQVAQNTLPGGIL